MNQLLRSSKKSITYVEPSILAVPLKHLFVGHYWQGE